MAGVAAVLLTLLAACSGGKADAATTPAYLVHATDERSGDIGIIDPEQIAISPDGERLYVASKDSGPLVTIGRDGRLRGTLAAGGEPGGVAVSPDATRAFSASMKILGRVTTKGGPWGVIAVKTR